MTSSWATFTDMFLDGCRQQQMPTKLVDHLSRQIEIEGDALRAQGVDIDRLHPNDIQNRLMNVLNGSLKEQPESWCGEGSYVANTLEVRQFLANVIEHYAIRTMADVACGDWNWMRLVDLAEVRYIGYDIDRKFIDQNCTHFAQHRFEVADALALDLPTVDLILCRDLMIHLPNDDIQRLLTGFRDSGSRYLMATSYDYVDHNRDFTDEERAEGYSHERRRSRMINLQLEPFFLPEPIEYVRENDSDACQRRIVGLWQL